MLAFCHTWLTFCALEWTVLMLWGGCPWPLACSPGTVLSQTVHKRMSQTTWVEHLVKGKPGERQNELCGGGAAGSFSLTFFCCRPEKELAWLRKCKPEKTRTLWNKQLHRCKKDYIKPTPHLCLGQPITYGPSLLLYNSMGSKGSDTSPFAVPFSPLSLSLPALS